MLQYNTKLIVFIKNFHVAENTQKICKCPPSIFVNIFVNIFFFWGGGYFLPFRHPLRGLGKIEDWVFDTLQNLCKKYTKNTDRLKISSNFYPRIHITGCLLECQYIYLFCPIVFCLFVNCQWLRSRGQFVPVLTLFVNRVHTAERLVRSWITYS